jgi:hypothetical protein
MAPGGIEAVVHECVLSSLGMALVLGEGLFPPSLWPLAYQGD